MEACCFYNCNIHSKRAENPEIFWAIGLVAVVIFNNFIFFINWGEIDFDLGIQPDVWFFPILEWAVYFSVIEFILLIALDLKMKKDKSWLI